MSGKAVKNPSISLFISVCFMLGMTTTHAWEWSWKKYQWQSSTNQSWKEYGKQKTLDLFYAIKRNPGKTTAITIGVGGLAIAHHIYQKKFPRPPANKRPSSQAGHKIQDDREITELTKILKSIENYWRLAEGEKLTAVEKNLLVNLSTDLFVSYQDYQAIQQPTPTQMQTLTALKNWRLNELVSRSLDLLSLDEKDELLHLSSSGEGTT